MAKPAKKPVTHTGASSRDARSNPKPIRIFLSYASSDKPLAIKVADELVEAGYQISNAEDVVEPGENWLAAVGRALDESDAIVVFLSRAALRSDSTSFELAFGLSEKRFKDRVASVLVDTEPSDIPWIVRRLPFIPTAKGADAGRIAQALAKELDHRV